MAKEDGKFTAIKRKLVGLSGVALLGCSIFLSKQGVGFVGDLWWMGLVVAISLTCAELMFNSSFEELSWTMVILGTGAYAYSIYTNIVGFYYYRGIPGTLFSNFDLTNFSGGFFMDVYPELAIAWALKESKVGDLFGNILKTYNNPDQLTKDFQSKTKGLSGNEVMSKLPQRPQTETRPSHFAPDARTGQPVSAPTLRTASQQGLAPTYHPPVPKPHNGGKQMFTEPTYHPIGNGFVIPTKDMDDDE